MSGRSGSAVAKHTRLAVIKGMEGAFALSAAGERILQRAKASGGEIHVGGAEVRACRSLVACGLGDLTDGEHWTFKINPRVSLRAHEEAR